MSGPPCVVNGSLLYSNSEPSAGAASVTFTSSVGDAEGSALGLLWEALPQPHSSSPSMISRIVVSPLRMVHPPLPLPEQAYKAAHALYRPQGASRRPGRRSDLLGQRRPGSADTGEGRQV